MQTGGQKGAERAGGDAHGMGIISLLPFTNHVEEVSCKGHHHQDSPHPAQFGTDLFPGVASADPFLIIEIIFRRVPGVPIIRIPPSHPQDRIVP